MVVLEQYTQFIPWLDSQSSLWPSASTWAEALAYYQSDYKRRILFPEPSVNILQLFAQY